MNQNYNLSWKLKRIGNITLINRSITFNWSSQEQTKTYSLPAEYKDLDYVTVEMTVTWTNSETNRKYTGPIPGTYSTQANFRSPSIAIQGGTDSTSLDFATKANPTNYYAINPAASGTLPLDSSLPWKAVSHSTTDSTMTGVIKATINNPYKNSTKDTYLHGTMGVGAEYYYPATSEYYNEIKYLTFDIDNNVLTVKTTVQNHYSLSINLKITGYGKFDMI